MIRKHDSVGAGKMRDDLLVVDEAVDECDPGAMTAALNEPERQIPALPGLTDDRQPKALDLVVVEAVERPDEILEPLVGTNDAEEEEIEYVGGGLATSDGHHTVV